MAYTLPQKYNPHILKSLERSYFSFWKGPIFMFKHAYAMSTNTKWKRGRGGKVFLKMAKKQTNPSPPKKPPNNPGYALQVAIRKSGKKKKSEQAETDEPYKKKGAMHFRKSYYLDPFGSDFG